MLPLAINFAKHPRVQSTSCWYTIRWAHTARPSQTIFLFTSRPYQKSCPASSQSLPALKASQLVNPGSSYSWQLLKPGSS